MTDLEISKALALAIGWREDQLEIVGDIHWGEDESLNIWCSPAERDCRIFDYRDWNVIGPIMERYVTEIARWQCNGKTTGWDSAVGVSGEKRHAVVSDYALRKSVALAVIQGAKK